MHPSAPSRRAPCSGRPIGSSRRLSGGTGPTWPGSYPVLLPHQVSPIVGMITGTLILVLVPATKRGHADQLGGQLKVHSSWLRDMKALIRK